MHSSPPRCSLDRLVRRRRECKLPNMLEERLKARFVFGILLLFQLALSGCLCGPSFWPHLSRTQILAFGCCSPMNLSRCIDVRDDRPLPFGYPHCIGYLDSLSFGLPGPPRCCVFHSLLCMLDEGLQTASKRRSIRRALFERCSREPLRSSEESDVDPFSEAMF